MKSKKIVDNNKKFRISPKDVDTTNHFPIFPDSVSCVAAGYVVGLSQSKAYMGDWLPFTMKEVEKLYQEWGHTGFKPGRLLAEGWIVQIGHVCFFTEEFIWECYKASPATEQTNELAQRITDAAKQRIIVQKLIAA